MRVMYLKKTTTKNKAYVSDGEIYIFEIEKQYRKTYMISRAIVKKNLYPCYRFSV